MIVCVDFDGTVVDRPPDPGDASESLRVRDDARMGLHALKEAGHTLILSSCRANTAQRVDWRRNPLWRNRLAPFDEVRWAEERGAWEASYRRMVDFVARELPGVFDCVDDGEQGKVLADLYVDDKAFRVGFGGWVAVAESYGEVG